MPHQKDDGGLAAQPPPQPKPTSSQDKSWEQHRPAQEALRTRERQLQLTWQILDILSRQRDCTDAIQSIVTLIKESTGIEVVGIRLRDGQDFPYYTTVDFPPEFVEAERSLCARDDAGKILRDSRGRPVLECLCGYVISGNPDPSLPFVTKAGSFWTNSTTELLATTAPQNVPPRIRGRCADQGYESLSLIPLRCDADTAGLLQLADHRKNVFTPEMMEFFEQLAAALGIAFARNDTERELRESERRFRELVEKVRLAAVMLDRAGNITFINDFLLGITGWQRRQVIGRNWFDLFIPESVRDEIKDVHHRCISENVPPVDHHENEILAKDGQRRLIVWNNTVLHDSPGNIIGTTSVGEDITQNRKMQESLQQSEQMMRSIFATVPDYILHLDRQGAITFINRVIPGSSIDEVVGTSVYEHIPPQYHPQFQQALATVLTHGETTEVETAIIPAGTEDTMWNLNRIGPVVKDGAVIGATIASTDITARKQAEDALAQSEERFRNLMEYIPGVSIQGYRPDGTVVYWNDASQTVYGYTAEEAIGKNLADLIIPDDLKPLFWQSLDIGKDLKKSGAFMPAGELMLLHKQRHLVPVYSIHTAVCIEGKEPLLFCIDVDLSQQKQTEETLRQNEEKLRAIVEHSNEMFYVHDTDHQLIYVSPQSKQIMGYSPREMMVKWTDLTTDNPINDIGFTLTTEAIQTGQRQPPYLLEVTAKDGTHRMIEVDESPLKDEEGKVIGVTGAIRDVTERKQAEEQLQRQQVTIAHISRLNTMGEMASAMAHELNQPLTAVLSHAEGCVRALRDQAPHQTEMIAKMGMIADQAELMGNIIRRIRGFVRKGESRRHMISVNTVVQDSLAFAEVEIRNGRIDLHTDLADDLPPLPIDPVQIEQVLLNLIRNAIDAMDELDHTARQLTINTSLNDGQVTVAVKDAGKGIPVGDIDRVFEPFFTTKAAGLGMGLSISHTIIASHGGKMNLTANTDHGVTCSFTLPIESEQDAIADLQTSTTD